MKLNELFEIAFKEHWTNSNSDKSGWSNQVKLNYNNHIRPHLGDMHINSITVFTVKKWHKTFQENIYAGNRSLSVLSKLLTIAEEMELRPIMTNPCRAVKNFPEVKRSRVFSEEEIKKIGEILERDFPTHKRQVIFIYLLMFTGSRPSAIERATFDQLQIIGDHGLLTFEGKTGIEQVAIPPNVMRMILSLRQTSDTILGIKMPRRYWAKVKAEAGCTDAWARDWRRTFASIALGEGISLSLIGESLNHKSSDTTKLYAKLHNKERFSTVDLVSNKIEQML